VKIDAQLNLIRTTLASGPRSAAELRHILGDISPATLSRLMARLISEVVPLGQTRAIRYARLRDVRGAGSRFPVYRIDESGNARPFGALISLLGGSFWWQTAATGGKGELYPHLPWFIQDRRPDGFMGRAHAQRVGPEMGLPSRLIDWNDDHVLVALSRRGEDNIGDLLVGEESLGRYLEAARRDPTVSSPDDYPKLAEASLAGVPAGSPAAGEQPKYTTVVERDGVACQVLVKFSPPVTTPEGERWSDLLVCEQLALNVVQEAGIPAASSRLFTIAGRTFLETVRFDRVGRFGRLPLFSLGVIDDQFFGCRDNWAAMAGRLEQRGMMSPGDCAVLVWLDLFGALIGNTDRHFGNVSVQLLDGSLSRFRLAPTYDMLPMVYRSRQGEELSHAPFIPPPLTSARTELVDAAIHHAALFWQRVAQESRLSPAFRELCCCNAAVVQRASKGLRVVNASRLSS
jgi:HipA-like C-terminal domain